VSAALGLGTIRLGLARWPDQRDRDVYALRAVNNGRAMVWWAPAGEEPRLVTVVADPTEPTAVAVLVLFAERNEWRQVARVDAGAAPQYANINLFDGGLRISWMTRPSESTMALWYASAPSPEWFRIAAPVEAYTMLFSPTTIGGADYYPETKYLSSDGSVFVWTETLWAERAGRAEQTDAYAVMYRLGGKSHEVLSWFADHRGEDLTFVDDAGAIVTAAIAGRKRASDPSVSVLGGTRVIAWEEQPLLEGGGLAPVVLIVRVEVDGAMYQEWVRGPIGLPVAGGDVSVSVAQEAASFGLAPQIYLGYQTLDGRAGLLAYPTESIGHPVTMTGPWVPAEPGGGVLGDGWLVNIASTPSFDRPNAFQVAACWEASLGTIEEIADHQAELAFADAPSAEVLNAQWVMSMVAASDTFDADGGPLEVHAHISPHVAILRATALDSGFYASRIDMLYFYVVGSSAPEKGFQVWLFHVALLTFGGTTAAYPPATFTETPRL